MMGLYFESELRQAESALNRLIEITCRNGGGVLMYSKDAPDFSVKLTQPISILFWIPLKDDEMLKQQNGYIFDGYTFVVNKSDVHNAPDDMFVEATAFFPVSDVRKNADRIRTMSDEELAKTVMCPIELDDNFHSCKRDGTMKCVDCTLNWLKQPVKENK